MHTHIANLATTSVPQTLPPICIAQQRALVRPPTWQTIVALGGEPQKRPTQHERHRAFGLHGFGARVESRVCSSRGAGRKVRRPPALLTNAVRCSERCTAPCERCVVLSEDSSVLYERCAVVYERSTVHYVTVRYKTRPCASPYESGGRSVAADRRPDLAPQEGAAVTE